MKNKNLLFNTVKHLKFSQVYWQIIYRIKKKTALNQTNNNIDVTPIQFQYYPDQKDNYLGVNHFRFLNLEKKHPLNLDPKDLVLFMISNNLIIISLNFYVYHQ